jgi:hypothetical protein
MNPPAESHEKVLGVTFGFWPQGFVPESLKGAPANWHEEYPSYPVLSEVAETHKPFLELLARHVEARMKS